MSKIYYVILKNGDKFSIDEEQFKKLSKVLLKSKSEIPNFIEINGNLIKTDFIASVKAESW
jgi:hypothetical protein